MKLDEIVFVLDKGLVFTTSGNLRYDDLREPT